MKDKNWAILEEAKAIAQECKRTQLKSPRTGSCKSLASSPHCSPLPGVRTLEQLEGTWVLLSSLFPLNKWPVWTLSVTPDPGPFPKMWLATWRDSLQWVFRLKCPRDTMPCKASAPARFKGLQDQLRKERRKTMTIKWRQVFLQRSKDHYPFMKDCYPQI